MKHSKNNIIWLVSYPKSGNTWVRIFLQHILEVPNEDVNGFSPLRNLPISSSRNLIDRYLGVSSANLTSEEIRNLQPFVYRELSTHLNGPQILKVHDYFGTTSNGEYVFPSDVSRAAVYIARNPLDVAVSYAFHSGKPIQAVIEQLNDPTFEISSSAIKLRPQVIQQLGTWSNHVATWTEQKQIPVIFITFEQLLENSTAVLRSLLDRLKIDYGEETFSRAINASKFSNLKKLEASYGFREKPPQAASFFREGKKDIYKNHLSNKQVQEIIEHHSKMMIKLGYMNVTI